MRKIKFLLKKAFSVKTEKKVSYKKKVLTLFGRGIQMTEKLGVSDCGSTRTKKYRNLKKLKTVDKDFLSSKIENMKEPGVPDKERQRERKLIVSLTSYPARIYDIHYCLYSLLSQTVKPDIVILWLAQSQFPRKEQDLPEKVLKLKEYGLSIGWSKDYKSYKKLVPALKEFPDDIIVTADDDIFYEPNWLEKLYKNYDGINVLCHRARKIVFSKFNKNKIAPYRKWELLTGKDDTPSFFNFFTGCGGVLYPPRVLYTDVLRDDLFMSLSETADDLWFWAMALLNNNKIKLVKDNISEMTYINPERELNITKEGTLHQFNYNKGNDEQLLKLLKHYPKILEVLHSHRERK